MLCPLCSGRRHQPSWFGSILYEGQRYDYVRCGECGSSYCDPMPTETTLARMYGPEYANAGADDLALADPKQPDKVLDWLGSRDPGVFVDFGCGSGSLLPPAREKGWKAVGVEFDASVANKTEAETGCPVVQGLDGLDSSQWVPADVIHLGDVIEHLPEPLELVRAVCSLVRPGGFLVAQGPLEAGPCLFTTVLRLGRWLRPHRVTEMPPYHVLQASVRGQARFFERLDLETAEYSVQEVSWPAPDYLTAADIRQPRTVALFLVRRASRAASAVQPRRWGNRYFFAGRRPKRG